MNNIPKKLNEEMNRDRFYEQCCLRSDGMCQGKVERHHALIFGGSQLQKKFAIVPACKDYHHRFAERKDIKERILHIVLNRATFQEILSISKAIDYSRMRRVLNEKYGNHI